MGQKLKTSKRITNIPEHPQSIHPSWRFSSIDKNGPFNWPKEDKELLGIYLKLGNYDSMTWKEIEGSINHFLDPQSVSSKARDRLEKLKLDDCIDQLFSFHVNGIKRIIGIRDRNIVKILWYDPTHEVCPSTKKHT